MDRAVELVRDALENNVEVTAFTLGLAHWVVASVVWSISRKTLENFLQSGLVTLIGTGMFYAVAVLFGAPLIANLERTIAWSFLVSSLAAAPAAAVAGLDWRNWHQIFISDVSFAGHRGVVYIIGASTIAGSWLGAIPIPLDWDRPWQVWPVSCVYGAIIGWLVGLSVVIVRQLTFPSQKDNKHLD